jgi:putative ABC transport system permease protein
VLGRTLELADDRPDSPAVVVLAHAMWRNRFGGDPQIIGRKLVLNGAPYVVAGVLPAGFLFPKAAAEYAIPLAADSDPARAQRESINFLRVVGRLRRGAGGKQAEADLSSIARQLRVEYPVANAMKLGVQLVPIEQEVLGAARQSLTIVVAAVSLLLLMVSVNVANSLLARASSRRKEVAIRAALGATRMQLVAQSLTENLLLTGAGGVLGIALAGMAVDLLARRLPASFPRIEMAAVDGTAVLYGAALSIAIGLLIAMLPARQRFTAIGEELKSVSRGGTGGRSVRRWRAALIVAEVALSFALLIGAGLLTRSLARLNRVDPGFESRRLLAVSVSLPRARYTNRESIKAYLDRAAPGLDAERRVESYSLVSILPVSGGIATVPFSRKDRPVTPERRSTTNYRLIAPDYFRTMRIPLKAGREFSMSDEENSPAVAIISDQLARRYLGDRAALGARLLVEDNDVGSREVEVVGVAGNVKQFGLDDDASADLYIPLRQAPNATNGVVTRGFTMVFRCFGDPRQMAAAVKGHLLRAEPEAAFTVRAMDDVMKGSLSVRRFQMVVMNLFAAFAVLLAGFGLYGVLSYLTAQRAQEIGIRMALGATTPGIAGMVIRQGLAFAAWGMIAGTVLAVAGQRLIADKLYMIGLFDGIAFGGSAVLILAIAGVASWLPARRAFRVDPLVVLRGE